MEKAASALEAFAALDAGAVVAEAPLDKVARMIVNWASWSDLPD